MILGGKTIIFLIDDMFLPIVVSRVMVRWDFFLVYYMVVGLSDLPHQKRLIPCCWRIIIGCWSCNEKFDGRIIVRVVLTWWICSWVRGGARTWVMLDLQLSLRVARCYWICRGHRIWCSYDPVSDVRWRFECESQFATCAWRKCYTVYRSASTRVNGGVTSACVTSTGVASPARELNDMVI